MSEAQDVRKRLQNNKKTTEEVNRTAGEAYFCLALKIFDVMNETIKIDGAFDGVAVAFTESKSGGIKVETSPEIPEEELAKREHILNLNLYPFNFRAFQTMRDLFASEEGFSAEVYQDEHGRYAKVECQL